MQPFSLPPDDLPSSNEVNSSLLWELDDMVSRAFYEVCDSSVQALLAACGWRLTSQGIALTLSIFCTTSKKNWQVLQQLSAICFYLSKFSDQAQICIYPPPETDTIWTVRAKEGLTFV